MFADRKEELERTYDPDAFELLADKAANRAHTATQPLS